MNKPSLHSESNTRGAALLVALGILAVLLVISITFFRMAIQEMKTANTNANALQADLMAQGAIARAMATLQDDLANNPAVTHSDQAWRTKYNGTAFVGKDWFSALGAGIFDGDIPRIDPDLINARLLANGAAQFIDPSDLDYRIYIPRIEALDVLLDGTDTLIPGFIDPRDGFQDVGRYLWSDVNGSVYPFAITTELGLSGLTDELNGPTLDLDLGNPFDPTDLDINFAAGDADIGAWLPEEQLHFIGDADVDEDGLNDAIWIPMAADRLYASDGLDNDLDGYIDEYDFDGEPGIFLYDDNFLRGANDSDADRVVRLTMPLDRMFMMRTIEPLGAWEPLDAPIGGVVVLSDLTFNPTDASKYEYDPLAYAYTVDLDDGINVNDDIDGDGVDNDYNYIVDDGSDAMHYALNRTSRLAMADVAAEPLGAEFNNHYKYNSLLSKLKEVIDDDNLELRILGEVTSTIVGRAAILITDESSKVNINEAGALVHTNDFTAVAPLTRATYTGLAGHEYDLRSLDQVGPGIGDRMWLRRMGAQVDGITGVALGTPLYDAGEGDNFDPTDIVAPTFAANYGNYIYDMSFPGYGFVDDDGSALSMVMNGIDDDGDAYWYQNDGIDNDLNDETDEPGEGRLVGVDEGLIPYDYDGDGFTEYATLEGIDEPGEFQRYRPHRNFVAEQDGDAVLEPNFLVLGMDVNDNDADGVTNEIGELADQDYRSTEQLKLDYAVVGSNPTFAERLFSTYEPFITVHASSDNLARDYTTNFPEDHTASAIKRDFNFATPKEIVSTLLRNFDYAASVPEILHPTTYASYALDVDLVNLPTVNFAASLRQEDTTVVSASDMLGADAALVALFGPGEILDALPDTRDEQVHFPADAELRAYQLAVSAKDFSDANSSRSSLALIVDDPWLAGETLSYTQAGVEAIRINEIMVRPVRRVEAEATPGTLDEYDPNQFNPGDFNMTVTTTAEHLEGLGLDWEAWYLGATPADEVLLDTAGGVDVWGVFNVFTGTGITPLEFDAGFNLGTGLTAADTDQPLMGIRSAYGTNQLDVGYVFDEGNPATYLEGEVPNLIQFSFFASPQLPAGRYYLTVNTQYVDDATGDILNTVDSTDDITYFIKTDTMLNDILTDMTESLIIQAEPLILIGGEDIRQSPVVLGEDGLGVQTGMAFMQSEDAANGYTVEVPTSGALHVAIMSNLPEGVSLAINYFDFSQEPDHEWVELVNVSDEEIDLSGWKLVVEGDNGIEMTVPDNTKIAPQGLLLLGTNKFDYRVAIAGENDAFPRESVQWILDEFALIDTNSDGEVSDTELIIWDAGTKISPYSSEEFYAVDGSDAGQTVNLAELNAYLGMHDDLAGTIYANGIGLARGLVPDVNTQNWFANVTVPPLLGLSIESVFARVADGVPDFVDNDGNAYSDDFVDVNGNKVVDVAELGLATVLDDFTISTDDAEPYAVLGLKALLDTQASGYLKQKKKWDRIVELEIPALKNLKTIGEIAKFVLDGGIFPNYPEMDGYDNDRDNLTLVNDIYDNNGNGNFIDVGNDGVFNIGADTHLNFNDLNGDGDFDLGIDTPLEGIDEGKLRLHPGSILGFLQVPGSYQTAALNLDMNNPNNAGVFETVGYPVASTDPPEWKAFVEKRIFPGDNVIVTLYEGRPSGVSEGLDITKKANIADQITYTEMDVIDRAKDDVLPYTATAAQTHINPALTSMWPPNTMGIDFYKSLERKHPLYNGDKHGTTNRSEPTDGAYDDWADSHHYHVREIAFVAGNVYNFNVANTIAGIENIFALGTANDEDAGAHRLFDHTTFGSPLRMNLSQRLAENPPIPQDLATRTEFIAAGQFEDALTAAVGKGAPLDRQLIYPLASVRNRGLVSPGDMLNLPHYDRIQRMRAPVADGFNVDFSAVNQRIVYDDGDGNPATNKPPVYADNSVRQIMLGQTFGDENWDTFPGVVTPFAPFFGLDYRIRDSDIQIAVNLREDGTNNLGNDLAQLIANTAANDAQSLSVATATVVPFDAPQDVVWDVDDATQEQGWNAVTLFPLLSPPVNFEVITDANFLYSGVNLATVIPSTVDFNRWPLERRAVAYASRNVSTFDSTVGTGKEAVFIWDGDAGVENGEYDVYLEVDADLSALWETHQDNALLNTTFGVDFVKVALRTDFESMLMDVEIFTDRDGNGRVWQSVNPEPTDYADLRATPLNESFEQLHNVAPDRNGFINYGPVHIENNYLAVMIRNRADSTVLNRISRVILAPRAKTPGRLNINTVETQLTSGLDRFFNPLIGLPGIQYGFNEFDGTYGQDIIADVSPTRAVLDYFPYLATFPYLFFNGNGNRPSENENAIAIHYRAQKITRLRPEHADGRYYDFVTDLVKPVDGGARMVYPSFLSDLDDDSLLVTPGVSGNEEAPRFEESQARFGRLVNMITTRSDIFKIRVLVETGYVTDVDNDTIENYRDDEEFTTTSQARASVVYER